ncbi:hypothetical protein PCANC_27246 [Puccinia coronata f. sp. avenae]|uniref:Uncharacterized protein n=1 Tax=Puccinia coronata f. sp. avenae TaxID=200324 RepID=A0A2N5TLI4_9BASI|nr:hypothetical protein PCANC_27246 [Puccinia coronata f. sp. avenae]
MAGRSWRRSSNDDNSLLSRIPIGANPFSFALNELTPRYFVRLSTIARTILMVFFVFHAFITLFCLALLLLPYLRGASKSQWLFRRLYIKDNAGVNVYKVPLLWMNTGILMTASQLMGSMGAQAFIYMQVKSALSPKYALHSQLEPALGVMYMGEMLTYWSLMHCFLVATYCGSEVEGDGAKGSSRWIPSPTILNTIFLGFPTLVVSSTVALFAWLCTAHGSFSTLASKVLYLLNQGSIIWDQGRDTSIPLQDKTNLMTRLFQVMGQVQNLRDATESQLADLVVRFRITQFVQLGLSAATFLGFLCFFSLLLNKYRISRSQSSHSASQSSFTREPTHGANRSLIQMAKSDRQFFHLVLRSMAMIVAMMTLMALFVMNLMRSEQVIREPRYRAIASWLATATGTWSAIPITWQCWGLYNDNLNRAAQEASMLKPPEEIQGSQFKAAQRGTGSTASAHWDCESEEIEFKSLSQQRNPFRA